MDNGQNKGEIVIYQPDEVTRLEVRVEGETVWLNRHQLASLFGRDVKTIGKHIKNALREELRSLSTVANFATVQKEGDRLVERNVEYYNLDMIISIGYRVKSERGVLFRSWANAILKEHLVRGYVTNRRIDVIGRRIDHHHGNGQGGVGKQTVKQVADHAKPGVASRGAYDKQHQQQEGAHADGVGADGQNDAFFAIGTFKNGGLPTLLSFFLGVCRSFSFGG